MDRGGSSFWCFSRAALFRNLNDFMSDSKPRWKRDKARERQWWNLWWKGKVIASVFEVTRTGEFRYKAGDKCPGIQEQFSLTAAKEEAMFRADW